MRRLVSSLIVALLFLGLFVFAFTLNIQPAKAQSGTIYIMPDGSITPSTANITTSDNVTYTFTGNNYLPIVVERSDIIINGRGHTLQASGENGFSLTGISNVTIKNTTVTNSYNDIYLQSSFGNVLSGNNITSSSLNGIGLYYSSDNVLSGNNVTTNSWIGIGLYYSSDNVLSDNDVTGNFIGIRPSYGSNNNVLSGNNVTANSWGIYILGSSDETCLGNNVAANGAYGIILMGSSGNRFCNNNITNNWWAGICFDTSSNNNISGNNISNDGVDGIQLYGSDNNTLSRNNVRANGYNGTVVWGSSGNVLSGNNVTANGEGIWLCDQSSGNTFYHNNFINNTQQVSSDGSPNTWDNGYPSAGNYWSDYTGVDLKRGPYQNLTGSDGIGDTPYVINANNIDHYPLMNPYSSRGLSVSILPSSSTLDVGQSQTFTSTASGGTLTYSYQWYLDGSPVSGANFSSWTCSTPSVGTHHVYLIVTDYVGVHATSNTATFTVNAALSASISPSSVILDVGQSQIFTSSVSGGTSPYTYRWYLNGTAEGTNCTWTFTPSSPGSYMVYVNATDNVGNRVKSNTATITVNGALSVTISPSSVTLDVGQSQVFTSSVSGGTSLYSYQWYLNGVAQGMGSTWTFTPNSSGSYNVYVNVTDNVGVRVKSNVALITVNKAPVVTISPTSVTLDVDQPWPFSGTVSGGTPPYTAGQWYLNGTAVPTGSIIPYTMLPPGFYTVNLKVTDAVGVTATSNTATLRVNPAPSVTVSPSPVVMDVGQSQTFTSTVSGGTSPYSYQWYLDGCAVSGATGSSYTYTAGAVGSHSVYVKVTDSATTPVTAQSNTASVTVNAALSVIISPSTVTLDVGQSQTFTSTVSGGTSPFSYQWYLNGVANGTGSSWTFKPSSAGSYSVYVDMTDNVGVKAKSNIATITVNAALSVTISPTSVTLDVGQSQTFTSTVSGGASPYSYQWYLDGSAVSGATSSSWTFPPSSSGSYSVYVNVTDGVGFRAKSNVASITVKTAPPPPTPVGGVAAIITPKPLKSLDNTYKKPLISFSFILTMLILYVIGLLLVWVEQHDSTVRRISRRWTRS